jgi:hypothetical protein
MIVTKINAGLGNQMFQYAIGYASAKRHKVELFQDISQYLYAYKKVSHPRNYKLNLYNTSFNSLYRLPVDCVFEGLAAIGISCNKIRDRYIRTIGGLTYVMENLAVDTNVIEDNSYLQGYWQSEQYFKEYAEDIRNELTLKMPINDNNAKWKDLINSSNFPVSLHYRRGDYHISDHLDDNYYINALNCLADNLNSNDLSLFVFSDQPEWARNNLDKIMGGKHRIYIVDANTEEDGHFDLELMRNCRYHITANSSFSWWAAWLCGHDDKIVIAPELSEDKKGKTARPCTNWMTL